MIREDDRYGMVTVMSWGGLHPKLACRGHFETMDKPPVITCHLIRVTVEHLSGGRVVPGPLWLWWTGPGMPDLNLCPRGYLHRFDLEHAYRFAKSALGWHKAARAVPGAVRPLDLDRPLRDHPAAAGPRPRRGPPPALGAPPVSRWGHPGPRPPGFRPPGCSGPAHPPEHQKASKAGPGFAKAAADPSTTLRRDQESSLTRSLRG